MTSTAMTGKKACVGGIRERRVGEAAALQTTAWRRLRCLEVTPFVLCCVRRQGYAASGFDKHGYDR